MDINLNHVARKDIILLLLLSTLVFVLNLWGYPLFDVDEPRYAETAREMLTSPGDWITPHFNWRTRFDKPVLFYWLIAGSYQMFGISEFSARLVSALAATGIVVMLYFFMRHVLNRKAALIAAVVFATMLEVYVMARWAITDMTLTCFMTGAWLSLFLVLIRSPRWYVAAGLFAGLGMLTKGPIALVLPGLTFLIALFWQFREKWRLLISPWMLAGLGVFLAVAMPWYIAVAMANPTEFVGKFFLLHNVERFTSTVSGHSGPWYYYVPVILAGAFPWTLFLPGLTREWLRQRSHLPAFLCYAAIWFWVVFLFYSASGTKLLTYVLCAYPALAILLGWFWVHQTEAKTEDTAVDRKTSVWLTRGLWISSGVLLLAFVLAATQPFRFVPEGVKNLFTPFHTQVVLGLLLLTFAVAAFCMQQTRFRLRGLLTLHIGMVITLIYVNLFLLPQMAHICQSELLSFVRRAKQDNAQLVSYSTKKTSLVFYAQEPILHLPDVRRRDEIKKMTVTIKRLLSKKRTLYFIVRNRDIPVLSQAYPVVFIQKGNVYSLVQVDKNTPELGLVLFR